MPWRHLIVKGQSMVTMHLRSLQPNICPLSISPSVPLGKAERSQLSNSICLNCLPNFSPLPNIQFMDVTDDVSQLIKDWLKLSAELNIHSILFTDDVSQLDKGLLNCSAPLNMFSMDVTDDVSHLPKGWLNWEVAI